MFSQSCLTLLDSFFNMSGLRINRDKTKAIWLDWKKRCGVELLPESRLQWIHCLGITLNQKIDDYGVNLNYETKIREIEKLLKSWSFRQLTLLGKITIVKSLAIPELVHLFETLPNRTNALIYIFIWSIKADKIVRNIFGDIPEGGLRMCHTPSY